MDPAKVAALKARERKRALAERKLTVGQYAFYTGKSWEEAVKTPVAESNFIVKIAQYERVQETLAILNAVGAAQHPKSQKSYTKALEGLLEKIKASL